MKQGLTPLQQTKTLTILDRAVAIQTAYQLAQPNDVLLIAGKGHESYQEIAGIRYPLSDEAIVKNLP